MDVPTILKRIELRIIELGMTKTEFYEKSGISSATYSQWNTNTFQPSKRKLMGAASALKMTYEELVGEKPENEQKQKSPPPKAGSELSEDQKYLIDFVSNASSDTVHRLRVIVEQVLHGQS